MTQPSDNLDEISEVKTTDVKLPPMPKRPKESTVCDLDEEKPTKSKWMK